MPDNAQESPGFVYTWRDKDKDPRLTAKERAFCNATGLSRKEFLKTKIGRLYPQAPQNPQLEPTPTPDADASPDADEKALCARLGIEEAQYLKTRHFLQANTSCWQTRAVLMPNGQRHHPPLTGMDSIETHHCALEAFITAAQYKQIRDFHRARHANGSGDLPPAA